MSLIYVCLLCVFARIFMSFQHTVNMNIEQCIHYKIAILNKGPKTKESIHSSSSSGNNNSLVCENILHQHQQHYKSLPTCPAQVHSSISPKKEPNLLYFAIFYYFDWERRGENQRDTIASDEPQQEQQEQKHNPKKERRKKGRIFQLIILLNFILLFWP